MADGAGYLRDRQPGPGPNTPPEPAPGPVPAAAAGGYPVPPGPQPAPNPGWPGPAIAPAPPPPKPSKPQPTGGWRRAVHLVSFGLINPGPSKADQYRAQLEAAIRMPLHGNYKVGVLGKGGVGKTSVAASIGSLFAELRAPDHVVALDADTAFGRLAGRIDPSTRGSYWELAADKNLETFTDVTARLGRNGAGLYMLAGEPPGVRRRMLDPAIYREAARRLDQYFTISVVDCGSTMEAPVTQEALRDLDALIVVSSPWADGAAAAAQTMEWLAHHGHSDLLARTVVVLNDSDGHADKKSKAALAEQFTSRGQAVVTIPFDPHLRPGGVIDVAREMSGPTRLHFLQIAATVAGFFAHSPRK